REALDVPVETRRSLSDRAMDRRFGGSSQYGLGGSRVAARLGPQRGLPAEGLAGSAVECGGDRVEVVPGVPAQVGALGKVLPQQAVGVLVGAALPGAVRGAEVDGQPRLDAQLGVLGHLRALIPGQGAAQLLLAAP